MDALWLILAFLAGAFLPRIQTLRDLAAHLLRKLRGGDQPPGHGRRRRE